MNQSQSARRSLSVKWISFIAIDVALAIVLVYLFSARDEITVREELNDLGATVYPQQLLIDNDFSLEDQHGRPFTAQQLQGRWSMIFFGFTNCPNICPLTMVELGQFYRSLLANPDQDLELPQVIMVTVDPERDDQKALANYIANYHDDFLGLTGDAVQIRAFAEQLYVVVDSAEGREESGQESANEVHTADHGAAHEGHEQTASSFDHSGHISVISPDGILHAVIRLPHRDQNLVDAYQIITENWN